MNIARLLGPALRVALCVALCVALWGILLTACTSSPSTPPAPVTPAAAAPVGRVSLDSAGMATPLLDLGVAVFDQGLSTPGQSERVFPTLRKAESLVLPVILADTLEASGAFGVVRVVHAPTVHMALMLDGEILRADGAVLELQVRLRSATGEVLFDRAYRDEAEPEDYPVNGDPFGDLYRAVSNDVVAAVRGLDAQDRDALQKLALISFGADMAPNTFTRFIDTDGDLQSLRSYPADADPMLLRLQRLRRQDDLFIDSVDEQYSGLRDEVADSYALWREYSFELQRYGEAYRSEAQDRKRSARRGTYAAMQQVYGTYRKVKIQEQDLRGLVAGFSGESLETVLRVDDGVFRLSGSVEDRYAEWRRILSRIDNLETGGVRDP